MTGKRVKILRKMLKLTQGQFVTALGISRSLLSGIESEKNPPSKPLLIAIAHHYNARMEWLEKGEGEMLAGGEGGAYAGTGEERSIEKEANAGVRKVPVIGRVSAGALVMCWELPPEGSVTAIHVSKEAFGLRVSGDSMEPKFSDADVIVIDPLAQVKSGDIAIVEHDEEKTFKRVTFEEERILCQPLNLKQDAFSIQCTERTRLIGRVMAKVTIY